MSQLIIHDLRVKVIPLSVPETLNTFPSYIFHTPKLLRLCYLYLDQVLRTWTFAVVVLGNHSVDTFYNNSTRPVFLHIYLNKLKRYSYIQYRFIVLCMIVNFLFRWFKPIICLLDIKSGPSAKCMFCGSYLSHIFLASFLSLTQPISIHRNEILATFLPLMVRGVKNVCHSLYNIIYHT